jgi:beta-phosphoglucomutase-like phosphatase (HAD superfamily)
MRDFRDAKAMARSLRDALKAKAIETTHTETLELIAKAFGYENWNILSAKIEEAEPSASAKAPGSDDRSLSVAAENKPPPPVDALIKALEAQERVLLFCLGSGTDWKEAGVTFKAVVGLLRAPWTVPIHPIPLVRLVGPSQRLAITDAGRAVLRALLRDL